MKYALLLAITFTMVLTGCWNRNESCSDCSATDAMSCSMCPPEPAPENSDVEDILEGEMDIDDEGK